MNIGECCALIETTIGIPAFMPAVRQCRSGPYGAMASVRGVEVIGIVLIAITVLLVTERL
jgi:hypothetical protein